MIPGPAFIPAPHAWVHWPLLDMEVWYARNVPTDYRWQDATPHSPAGWVRPTGGEK